MSDEENCRCLLEMTLGMEIAKVEVSRERSIVYHPEYRGVRLDVYAKDEYNTRFNVEMQVVQIPEPGKRARYYHSQIDMDLLLSGEEYAELPEVYVIFICDFDPFGKRQYCYRFENRSVEDVKLSLGDGSHTIFLSTWGGGKKPRRSSGIIGQFSEVCAVGQGRKREEIRGCVCQATTGFDPPNQGEP